MLQLEWTSQREAQTGQDQWLLLVSKASHTRIVTLILGALL